MPVRDRPEAVDSHDRPEPDLQRRLERLPPDHPSSLYLADSTRKPSPPSLRGLELPLPGDEDEAPGADTPRGDYWTEVPRFQRMWTEHARAWPERHRTPATDHSHDPEGSWRGEGDQYLSPEQHAHARDVIGDVQRAEPLITGHVQEIERLDHNGAWLVGLEYRLKGEERLKEKIAEALDITPAITPEAAMRKVNDAIRYTFCFEPERYADGYADIRQRLEGHGYEMTYSKNYWNNAEYKGINTRWMTSEGQRFEVQFHTPESFHAKQEVTHEAYERTRNPLTSEHERPALDAFQREVSSWIVVPVRATDIPDYRREAH